MNTHAELPASSAHQWDAPRRTAKGRFDNPVPTTRPKVLPTLVDYVRGRAQTTPSDAVQVVRLSADDLAVGPESGLRLTWLGHATSLVELDGRRFLLDPVWAERASPWSFTGPRRFFEAPLELADLPPLDGVLISHDHYDHLDRVTVQRLAQTGVPFVVPLGVGEHLRSWGVEDAQITELTWWEDVTVSGVVITATPARHASGRSTLFTDMNATLWAGFVLRGPEHRVYYAGDTAMFDAFEEIGARLGPFDASLIEIGAYNKHWADLHLGPEQAVEAFQQVRGGVLIPVHWATFDLAMHSWTEPVERLLAAADAVDAKVAVPRPGQSVEPATPPPADRWWPDVPWQTAAQHPVRSSGLRVRPRGPDLSTPAGVVI